MFKYGVPLSAENGANIEVDASDFIGWQILNQGAYEPLTLLRASGLLANGGSFVDVGANVGLFAVYLGVLPGVSCVSIEPNPSTFLKLRRNIKLNPSIDTSCFLLAVSDKQEFLELEDINPGNTGTARVHSADAYATDDNFTVAGCPLQEALAHAGLQSITLLKIDVEGFEFSVLEGIDWQAKYRPQNVIIELSDYTVRFGHGGRKAMLRFFSERGYLGYTVTGEPLMSAETPVEDNAWFRDSAEA